MNLQALYLDLASIIAAIKHLRAFAMNADTTTHVHFN